MVIGLLALAAATALSSDNAGPVVSISPYTLRGPDLGKIAQGATGRSVWRINGDTGDVSLVSGDGFRLSSGPSAPPMITITCGLATCRGATVVAAFAPASGQATITGFTPGALTPKGLTLQSVSGSGTNHLVMTFLADGPAPASVTFPLGVTVALTQARDASTITYNYRLLVSVH